ncbi:MAG: sugar transferase [Bryobacteraceae bacterium]|jgi:lipopolysaccharide/colanic/teichoic acid biosynthesis glycosyltransferase
MSRSPSLLHLLDLALILAGFGAALFLYASLFPGQLSLLAAGELPGGIAASVFAVWVGAQLQRYGGANDSWQFFLEQLCLGAGLNLIVQALLAYVFVFSLPTTLTMTGCLFAALLLTLSRTWFHQRLAKSHAGVLLVGYDSIAREILSGLRLPVLGFVGARNEALPGVPWLGDVRQLREVVENRRPTHIVIGLEDWASRVSPTLLLQYRREGIVVDESPELYERLLRRVCSDRLQPTDLLLSPALQADSRAMALQAIYTNLIGLFFLLALAPLLALISLAVALFSGRGPVFETVPCLGFRKIPFLLLRFRTRRRDGSGAPSRIGRLISRLHLVNLPQLVNVVRGEMALFGPRPVRHEFAHRLTQLMPFYSHRFSVKPGILGWAQMHLRWRPVVPGETQQIEYDLYYVKEGSPLLDCEIFLRTLLGGTRPRRQGES